MRIGEFRSVFSVDLLGCSFALCGRARDRLLLALCVRSMVGTDELSEVVGIGIDVVRKVLNELRHEGLVSHAFNSRGSRWWVTEKGRDEVAGRIKEARELLEAFSRRID